MGRNPTRYTARDLLRIAERTELPIRFKGGHVIVTLPGQSRPAVFRHPARASHERLSVSNCVRQFREAGLIE